MRHLIVLAAFALPATPGCGANRPATGPTPEGTAAPSATSPPSDGTPQGTAKNPDVQRGLDALGQGQYPTARSLCEIAAKKNPSDAEAQFCLGAAAEKMDEKPKAEAYYRAALGLQPDLEPAAVNLMALLIDAKRFDDAVKIGKDAVAKRPDSGMLHCNLGVAFSSLNDAASAQLEFEQGILKSPDDAMCRFTYGHQLLGWKDADKAGAQLREALTRVKEVAENRALIATLGHDLLVARQPRDCVAAFDKAINLKDGAPERTERALCKLALKDPAAAEEDLKAAIQLDEKYGLPHYWLANRLAESGRSKDAIAQYEAYLALEPKGPLAQKAQERVKVLKKGPGK
jgi:Tfp pilus assembly protein PilF